MGGAPKTNSGLRSSDGASAGLFCRSWEYSTTLSETIMFSNTIGLVTHLFDNLSSALGSNSLVYVSIAAGIGAIALLRYNPR
jgi:hypothetical protein